MQLTGVSLFIANVLQVCKVVAVEVDALLTPGLCLVQRIKAKVPSPVESEVSLLMDGNVFCILHLDISI